MINWTPGINHKLIHMRCNQFHEKELFSTNLLMSENVLGKMVSKSHLVALVPTLSVRICFLKRTANSLGIYGEAVVF